MSVKLIGKIINSECYQLISTPSDYISKGNYYEIRITTKPLFPGDTPKIASVGYDDEATARSEFKLICEAAKDFGRG